MQDGAVQAKKAAKLIESLTPEALGFVAPVVVVKLFWVLPTACRVVKL